MELLKKRTKEKKKMIAENKRKKVFGLPLFRISLLAFLLLSTR